MIEMLKNWVRDLVILVIFASLIEMLLPGGALKKYVKVVMGFFIMLAVLNPFLSFLRTDYQAFYPFQTTPNQKVQREIQRKGTELQKHNEEMARANLEAQLAQQMRALILTQQDVTDARVQVEAGVGGQIQAVRVSLTFTEKGEEQLNTPAAGIPKVKNVQIKVGQPDPAVKAAAETSSDGTAQIREKVQKLLGTWYSVKPEVIQFEE